ncbi:MAG: serine hydrolase domain-containing protein [Pseudoxanthomonas sp.]
MRLAVIGSLLGMTLPTIAQTPTLQPALVHEPIAQPLPYRQAPAPAAKPLAASFNVADFEALAQDLTVGERVPGLAMAIVHDGQVLSARGYGVTDVRDPQPVNAHTVFRMASLSKAFAGTMTGLLVQDGVLRWDSKVADYVPSFHLADPQATGQVTVADLLSHRTGLRWHNAFDSDIENNADYYTVSQKLATAPLGCRPGECYNYQNVAFSLVGDVVFAATGSFYEQAVDRRIFKPLGMNDASIGLAGIEGSPSWAHPHVRGRGGWASIMPKPTYYRLAPAAGVNASISDLAQWVNAQLGHRPDVLPAPLLATLHAPLISTPGEMKSGWRHERVSSSGYAMGWRVLDYAGEQVIFHAGAVEGYRGLVAMVPGRDLGLVILWNSTSALPSGLLPTVLDAALGLPAQQWVDSPLGRQWMLAQANHATSPRALAAEGDDDESEAGASSGKSVASPR